MISQQIRIESASTACLPEVLALLAAADLPHEGVREHLGGFLIARTDGGRAVGCVGLERYGTLGLLRSAAVLTAYQGQQIGARLVQHLLEDAARKGVTEVVLLTTSAKDYFQTKFGFREQARGAYEERLAASPEWKLPRCASAVLLARELDPPEKTPRVLILCTGNSARSQMAEGLLRSFNEEGGGAHFEVHSAGTRASFVRPEAIRVMAEIGIDISHHRSKNVDEFAGQQFDYVITVCDHANEVCPVFSGPTQRIHQSFEDPPAPGVGGDAFRLEIFRRVRDELRLWLEEFVRAHSTGT